jgi:outer membrane lipopolysaccharide assembly protein LptE/RlpB
MSSRRIPPRSASLRPLLLRRFPFAALTAFTAFAALATAACGHALRDDPATTEEIAECHAYEAAYHACAARLGETGRSLMDRQTASLHRALATSSKDPATVTRRRRACLATEQQLARACR